MPATKLPLETWLVDFLDESGKKIETKEIHRAYAPTRWANNYVLTLRRRMNGAKVTYSIERMS